MDDFICFIDPFLFSQAIGILLIAKAPSSLAVLVLWQLSHNACNSIDPKKGADRRDAE
ncbi:hypothetical protein [Paenibacillus silviterrae]|uniref:hypothetical protein n=1 Tax=Paenibacillus silviterrae TaxID=3242194 RepID=UPI002543CC54|nr:hypothetical protein [Paenibacillus chinjuensis]